MTKWVSASRKPDGPGEFGRNPSGFGFVRCTRIGLAKSLDLDHEFSPAERLQIDKTCSTPPISRFSSLPAPRVDLGCFFQANPAAMPR
jgi:hypothetical protein